MTNVGAAVESHALLIKIRMTLIIMVTVWAIMESRQTSRHKYSSGALFNIAFASYVSSRFVIMTNVWPTMEPYSF